MKIVKTSKGRRFVSPQIVYKKLLDTMNEAVWLGDKYERTVYANKKFADMLGYTLDEMIGRESYDFWDKESADRVKNVNDKDRKQGKSSSYEGNLLTKDGKLIPVLLSGAPFPGGGTVGIMTDLSELKKKEEQATILNKSIEYSTDAIITFDKNLKVQTWNKGAKMMFGYNKDDLINNKITKIISGKELEKYVKYKKEVHNFQIKGKNKAKKALILGSTLTYIKVGEKNDLVYLLIARDITKQIKFEEELAKKYKKLKEAYTKFETIKNEMDSVMTLFDKYKKSK